MSQERERKTKSLAALLGIPTATAAALLLLFLGPDRGPDERTAEQLIEQQTLITGFTSRAEALFVSATEMSNRQSRATQEDPRTVTRYLWDVIAADGPGEPEFAIVIEDAETNRIPAALRGRTDTRGPKGGRWNPEIASPPTAQR